MARYSAPALTRPRGRPTKLNADVQARFVAAVKLGTTRRQACLAAGISDETLSDWLARGERGQKQDAPFAGFLGAVRAAEAEVARTLTGLVLESARGLRAPNGKVLAPPDWRAAAWLLERRFPQDFGRSLLEVSGPDGGPIRHDLAWGDAVREAWALRRAKGYRPPASGEPASAGAADGALPDRLLEVREARDDGGGETGPGIAHDGAGRTNGTAHGG